MWDYQKCHKYYLGLVFNLRRILQMKKASKKKAKEVRRPHLDIRISYRKLSNSIKIQISIKIKHLPQALHQSKTFKKS
jgi:hypothetical protein